MRNTLSCLIGSLILTGVSHRALGASFSIAPTPGLPFPSATGFLDDDILAAGPAATLQFAGAGVVGPNINAISFGRSGVTKRSDILVVEYSVAMGSFGAPGSAVAAQVAAGEPGADIFASSGGGTNTLIMDGDGMGPAPVAPPMGVFEATTPPPATFGVDEVDAWDNQIAPPSGSPVYFSPDFVTGSSDFVFVGSVGAGYDIAAPIYAGPGALGLGIFPGNDIDALVVIDNDGVPGTFTPGTDVVLFSLAIGSPTLAIAGAAPGDILIDPAGAALFGIPAAPGLPGVLFSEASLGLTPALAELDALDIRVVPEPSSTLLLGVGIAALAKKRRRRPPTQRSSNHA